MDATEVFLRDYGGFSFLVKFGQTCKVLTNLPCPPGAQVNVAVAEAWRLKFLLVDRLQRTSANAAPSLNQLFCPMLYVLPSLSMFHHR